MDKGDRAKLTGSTNNSDKKSRIGRSLVLTRQLACMAVLPVSAAFLNLFCLRSSLSPFFPFLLFLYPLSPFLRPYTNPRLPSLLPLLSAPSFAFAELDSCEHKWITLLDDQSSTLILSSSSSSFISLSLTSTHCISLPLFIPVASSSLFNFFTLIPALLRPDL